MKQFVGYQKGINLGGWLSQCCHTKEHYDSFITEDDFKVISTWELDHLRIPVDYNLLETQDGQPLESGMQYLQMAVDWCGKYGLNMILDLHKTAGYSFDDGEGIEIVEYDEKRTIEAHAPYLYDTVKLLLKHGLNPNMIYEDMNIMQQLRFIETKYVAADTLGILLENGGRYDLAFDGEILFDEIDFDVVFGAIEQENRGRYDSLVHCWLVLLLDDSAVLVELLNGVVTSLGCHGVGFKCVRRFSFLAELLLIGSTFLVLLYKIFTDGFFDSGIHHLMK